MTEGAGFEIIPVIDQQDVKVTVEKKGKKAVMFLEGDITSFSEDTIMTQARPCIADHMDIVMNFEGVEYINSSGIAIIIAIVADLMKVGKKLIVVNLTPHYRKVFSIVGMDKYIVMTDSLEKALAVSG